MGYVDRETDRQTDRQTDVRRALSLNAPYPTKKNLRTEEP